MPEKPINIALPSSVHKKLKRLAESKRPRWKMRDAAVEAVNALLEREKQRDQAAPHGADLASHPS